VVCVLAVERGTRDRGPICLAIFSASLLGGGPELIQAGKDTLNLAKRKTGPHTFGATVLFLAALPGGAFWHGGPGSTGQLLFCFSPGSFFFFSNGGPGEGRPKPKPGFCDLFGGQSWCFSRFVGTFPGGPLGRCFPYGGPPAGNGPAKHFPRVFSIFVFPPAGWGGGRGRVPIHHTFSGQGLGGGFSVLPIYVLFLVLFPIPIWAQLVDKNPSQ